MTLPLVILTHPLPSEWIANLDGRVELLVGQDSPSGFSPELLVRIIDADGILCLLSDKLDKSMLEKATKLRVVTNMAAGYDNIDIATCTRLGIPVGNTPDILSDATADLAMALLLSQARIIPQAAADAKQGLWRTWSPTGWLGSDIQGSTLGIVGLGKIGLAVAKRAQSFGLKIVYSSSQNTAKKLDGIVAERVNLNELLEISDFVSLHCPLTSHTRGMVDEVALKRMKPSAILINTARGAIVVQDALVKALKEDWIRGAALDVTDPEPLPPTHPLFSLPNCLIVPHIGSATFGVRKKMAEMACANLIAGLDGLPLPNQVNREVPPKIYS